MTLKSRTRIPRTRWRPWLWPYAFAARLTRPVSPSLWLLNAVCQWVLRINSEIPWNVYISSRVKEK